MMKKNLNLAIKEAMLILLIAVVLGMVVNFFHPKHVQIATRRPSLKFAPDTVLAQDLPGVSFSDEQQNANEKKEQIQEPLLITTAQVLQLKAGDMALLLDARSKAEFEKSHIPGAQNVPYQNLSAHQAKLDSLPDDRWLICYCDGPPCHQAESLAYELIKAGHELVAVYFDGLKGWNESGQKIEGKEAAKHEN
ncbi:MAG TPA: rhodanese-like domain-containing protein [bacterium]